MQSLIDNTRHKHSAFTLIELLVVVAIIAVLAGIALINFQEAQVRSKVSRAKADMPTITPVLASYKNSNTQYFICLSDTSKNTNTKAKVKKHD